jgi:hypothetical protein
LNFGGIKCIISIKCFDGKGNPNLFFHTFFSSAHFSENHRHFQPSDEDYMGDQRSSIQNGEMRTSPIEMVLLAGRVNT